MAAPAPNAFSNHLESWVYKEAIASVVLVTYEPKNFTVVKGFMDKIDPLPKNQSKELTQENKKRRIEDSQVTRSSTGFIIKERENHLDVLTCVHTLDHVFNAKSPISTQDINRMFTISILCDHGESKFRLKQASTRAFITAAVVEVDCAKDLLLLRVAKPCLQEKCKELHRPLALAKNIPGPLERVVMLSWPPFRPRTACVGETSHPARDYSEAMIDSPDAHSVNVSEVSIMADRGSSGAPLLNGGAQVVGLLHGGSQSSLCYFISFQDIRTTLLQWGVTE